MNDNGRKSEYLRISLRDADRLLERADGTAALLYLHICRRGTFAPKAAAQELRLSAGEIDRAARTLQRLGLLEESTAYPHEREELPSYSPSDIAARAQSDSAFDGVVTEAQRLLGRHLNTNDLRVLFGIYDYWGLPADVIYLLLNHCIETYQYKNGEGRLPTFRYIEQEARHWARYEINSYEAAEEHIARELLRRQDIQQLKEILQIRGRDFTPTERKYAEGWLELGLSLDALAIAYDRTVVGTGRLTWKYMDKIVRDWHSKGLLTAEAVERGDARFGQRSTQPQHEPTAGNKEIENMRRMYEHMKRGT